MREKEFDVVIVGSGAGGGAVAAELGPLAATGARVAVLEWGPKVREQEFTGRELEMANRLYFDRGGVLTRDMSMTMAFGKGYGGSTVVYTGTSLTIPPQVVTRWNVPGLEAEDVLARSEKYLRQNNVHLLEEPLLNDNNRLFREGCRRLGWTVEQFPINVKGCLGAGLCNLGCPNAAKQGTNRVQLPAAERQGVQVVTNCKVERIEESACVVTVRNESFGEPSGWEPGEYRVKAKAIVVAAGAVNSPALLLRSRLPVELPALGCYFTAHPALILVAQHERPITNYSGHPKSFYCDQFAHSKRFLLETCMYFPFTTAKSLAGFGADHSRLMSGMDRLQMILALALDDSRAENRVTIDAAGNAVVDYRLSEPVLDALHEAMKASARIFFAAGAARVHAPAGSNFLIEASERHRIDELIPRSGVKPGKVSIVAAHLMGGCRMGTGRGDSVTDSWGRVHGVPGLYVADASLFPACAEINPYVTIMALADRVAEGVRNDLSAPPASRRAE
ncbi:MAG: GMC family oxidoreductase [Candidatus Wallbacteria bacterium]|nr:GMC family oxidoreductase [Candidatus Wallbacteria bacterium]